MLLEYSEFGSKYSRLPCLPFTLPIYRRRLRIVPIQVLSQGIQSEVSPVHSIRIQHGDHLEHELRQHEIPDIRIAICLRVFPRTTRYRRLLFKEKAEKPVQHVRALRFAWVHTGGNEDRWLLESHRTEFRLREQSWYRVLLCVQLASSRCYRQQVYPPSFKGVSQQFSMKVYPRVILKSLLVAIQQLLAVGIRKRKCQGKVRRFFRLALKQMIKPHRERLVVSLLLSLIVVLRDIQSDRSLASTAWLLL